MCNVPLIMIDIPYNNTVDVHDDNVKYVRAQFDKAIKQLEELTGKKFDEKKFEKACSNANRTAQAWLKAVSYTHLDVYKRQISDSWFQREPDELPSDARDGTKRGRCYRFCCGSRFLHADF